MSPGSIAALPEVDMIVPLRMRWDVASITSPSSRADDRPCEVFVEARRQHMDAAYWHASFFTAAVLRLLDIPMDRIIMEKGVRAKKLVLPWMQGWCPLQVSSVQGVAKDVSTEITQFIEKVPEGFCC